VCTAVFKAQIRSSPPRARPVSDSGRNGESLPWLYVKCLAARDFYFQLAFEHDEALVRMWMMMPRVLSFHYRDSDGVLIHSQQIEVAVRLAHGSSCLLYVDDR